MKTGLALPELAKQIKREHKEAHDFRAPTTKFHYQSDADRGFIRFKVDKKNYEAYPTNHCLRQIGARVGIPSQYVDKMRGGHCPLLADNINWWWKNTPEKRMLRTLCNGSTVARAFLSEVYRPLDNFDLAEVVLPVLNDAGCEILSSQITETRMYIQAATPRLEADLARVAEGRKTGSHTRVNDPVQAGIVISNSEVGSGALKVEPMLYRLVCLNGLVLAQAIRKFHIGKRSDPMFELDQAAEYYSDATRQLDDKAFWSKVRDVVTGIFDKGRFQNVVEKFASTKEQKINGIEAVEEITQRFQLRENEKEGVLNHLIEGGDLSLFGLINAVTAASSDIEDYDRAVDFERFGGEIMELPRNVWNS
jgi:hypothetical protein